ncbi:hypothetical protein KUTeg_004262 [Tegillarca granosa]|uniref:Progestin and adipoQ receptor family member 3 n=1 Tax=Tegillarca granosa TaxID=220873 RepID=A0ABQ9FR08_TEGGR|nr:hypothetical protein KUTeg_004262 [Tegillarca granosa]
MDQGILLRKVIIRLSAMMGRIGNSENNIKKRETTHANLTHTDSYHILDIEIDRGIDACSNGLCDVTEKDIPLFKYNEIPEFLHGNPYVVKGYRVCLPFSLCLKSLFLWSNETVNIWSHLLGFFVFLFLMLYDNLIALPYLKSGYTDHLIVTIGLICYQFCMLCSTGFHMFACHSERASKRWLAVDLAGISIGIIGCYLPAVHYAFYCLSIWRDVYLITIAVLSTATLLVQLHPNYHSWTKHRLLIYCGLVAYGIIPSIHWTVLNGGISSHIVQRGTFDFMGSSHQWWHVIIVFAFLYWHYAGQDLLDYRLNHPCNAY